MKAYWISSLTDSFLANAFPTGAGQPGSGVKLPLPEDSFRHLIQVCRHKKGDHFMALSPTGKCFEAQITEISKKSAQIEILKELKLQETPKPYLHLCLSIPKFHHLDLIVEKSVELGIKSLRLFTSDFSFVKTSANGKPSTNWTLARMERLKKIVISASEQSKRPDLMKIHEPISYSDLLSEIFAHPPTNLTPLSNCLFFYEASPELPFLEHQSLQQCQLNLGEDCFYFVGSEGGFSQAEARLAKEKGCQIVYLGERVLRVETACIAITSVLKYKLGL